MEIFFNGSDISVKGKIYSYGKLVGTYVGKDFVCANTAYEASFRYELASGNTGILKLSLIVPSPNSIIGYYIDNGFGDRGYVELTRESFNRFSRRGNSGFFSSRDKVKQRSVSTIPDDKEYNEPKSL